MLKDILEQTFLEHIDPRRKQEKRDARMVHEDHNAVANLSPEGFQKIFDPWKDVERLGVTRKVRRLIK